jgi:hypothetical protein
MKILLNLGMEMLKNQQFNAQGSRLIIVALQVGAVMEAAKRKRKDRVKLSSPQKLRSPRPPPLNEC